MFLAVVVTFLSIGNLSTSLIYVFVGAISGTILHLSLALSYKYADLSVTQPIWFTGLIFGSGIGYFAFNETPDLWTWLGGIVVFSSVLVIHLYRLSLIWLLIPFLRKYFPYFHSS